jgi:hypothetical protein
VDFENLRTWKTIDKPSVVPFWLIESKFTITHYARAKGFEPLTFLSVGGNVLMHSAYKHFNPW